MPDPIVDIWVPGEPVGKGRPRSNVITRADGTPATTRNGRFAIGIHTPAKTRKYEQAVGLLGKIAMKGRPPLPPDVGVELHVMQFFLLPASWSATRQRQALVGEIRPLKTPDFDNVLKAICDGLNGIVWSDDDQAADGAWTRRYALRPGVRIRVFTLDGAAQAEIADPGATEQLPF
jgi:Holliday junction resolvase RusA-like endonuclease